MKEKRTLLYLTLGGFISNLFLVGAGFSFYFFFIQPTFTSYTDTSKELATLEARDAFLRTSEREMEQISGNLATLDAAFLNLENAIPFVTLLETIATKSNVVITIQAEPTIDSSTNHQAEFSVTAVGTLAQIMQFIKQMELIPYFTDITSLNISTKNTQVQATMRMVILTI